MLSFSNKDLVTGKEKLYSLDLVLSFDELEM